MRIGLVIYGDFDTISGGYLYDRKLVEYLRACGDQVDIISQPWQNYVRHLAQNFDTGFIKQISEPYDILLQDELNHSSLFFANRRRKKMLKSCPVISIVHHLRCSEQRSGLLNMAYRWVERSYLQGVDGFIFNSATTGNTVTQLVGNKYPFVLAYPGGDRFSEWEYLQNDSVKPIRDDDLLRILFVGNLDLRKGLHVLLAALCQLSSKDRFRWHLTVVGDNNKNIAYAKKMLELANQLKLSQNITWLGAVDDTTLARQYATHDLFVLPSQYEGFGIVYLEAMSFSLPVIASSAGAAHEIINTGENGFLVPPENPSALAMRLQTLLNNKTRLQAMRVAARKHFEQHPTWAQTAQTIRQFLLKMAN